MWHFSYVHTALILKLDELSNSYSASQVKSSHTLFISITQKNSLPPDFKRQRQQQWQARDKAQTIYIIIMHNLQEPTIKYCYNSNTRRERKRETSRHETTHNTTHAHTHPHTHTQTPHTRSHIQGGLNYFLNYLVYHIPTRAHVFPIITAPTYTRTR